MNGLAFFHPEFLWALALCAVPVLLHFLMRRPSKKFAFSTLRFFSVQAQQASRLRKIRRLLLLLVRLAILVTIVLLFLSPFDKSDTFGVLSNPDVSVYAWVDPTVSMTYNDAGKPLWKKAFFTLDSLETTLPSSAKRYLYDDSRAGFIPIKNYTVPAGNFTRHGNDNCDKMIASFANASDKERGNCILVVLSDYQKAITMAVEQHLDKKQIAPVALVSVAPHDAYNFSITNADAPAANRAVVHVGIRCIGKQLKNAGITITGNGMSIGHAQISCDAGSSKTISVPVTASVNAQTGIVSLDAVDPFTIDNSASFVRGASVSQRVLLVGENSATFPLSAAFAGMGDAWTVQTKPVDAVLYSDIDSVSLIALCGIRRVTQPLSMLLHSKAFGEKAIIMSPETDSSYSTVNQSILPLTKNAKLLLVSNSTSRSVQLPDTLSELFSGFPQINDRDAQVSRYFAGLPGIPLVKLDNGYPLITHLVDSTGKSWIICATSLGLPVDNRYSDNNLYATGLFVPLIDRLSKYALSALHHQQQIWTAGVAQKNPYYGAKGGAQIFDAGGRNVATWAHQQFVSFNDPGCYRVQPVLEPAYWCVVKIDSAEIQTRYELPEIKTVNRGMVRAMTADQFVAYVKSKKGQGYARWIWLVLGVLLVAEVLLWEKKEK